MKWSLLLTKKRNLKIEKLANYYTNNFLSFSKKENVDSFIKPSDTDKNPVKFIINEVKDKKFKDFIYNNICLPNQQIQWYYYFFR